MINDHNIISFIVNMKSPLLRPLIEFYSNISVRLINASIPRWMCFGGVVVDSSTQNIDENQGFTIKSTLANTNQVHSFYKIYLLKNKILVHF